MNKVQEPFLQLCTAIRLVKPLHFLCLHLTVSHLYPDLIKIPFLCINTCITLGLSQMYHLRFFDHFQIHQDALDLIDRNPVFLLDNPVSPPLHDNLQFLTGHHHLQRHFRMISASHLPLNLSVNPPAKQHSLPIRGSTLSVVQIPLS